MSARSSSPSTPAQARSEARAAAATSRPRDYSRKRTAVLVTVYVLIGLHIAHWKLNGRTLAPLELNEVMYTAELGIVTAGFLLMVTAALATAVFGRFFCSWACHILALEDLCAWLLAKIGIRPKPVRSRLLLWVPPLALGSMFVWPQVVRLWAGRGLPELHLASDAQGWASFQTSDFWRNLPDPGIALLTFAVCGFAIVYVLGSRAFCTYGCPYGAVFGLLDRFAPGRIRQTRSCIGCAACTAVCQSHIQVHDELRRFGTVVNPACLKDLDCVAVCPTAGVTYGFGAPPLVRSRFGFAHSHLSWDLSWAEELVLAGVFLAALFTFRGLYDAIPFLLTLGLGGILAWITIVALRLWRRPAVKFAVFPLKRAGVLTRAGRAYLVFVVSLALFCGHSAYVRWNERTGRTALAEAEAALAAGHAAPESLTLASSRLARVADVGLWVSPALEQDRARVAELRGDTPAAEEGLRRTLARAPGNFSARLSLARMLVGHGGFDEARSTLTDGLSQVRPQAGDHIDVRNFRVNANQLLGAIAADTGDTATARAAFEAVLAEEPNSPAAHVGIGRLLADEGHLPEAEGHLARAVELAPHAGESRYDHAVLLSALGRDDEALSELTRAVELIPNDADVRNNLGRLLADRGRGSEAEVHLREATRLQPGYAAAHWNLGRVLSARGATAESAREFAEAARLDPRYPRSGVEPR